MNDLLDLTIAAPLDRHPATRPIFAALPGGGRLRFSLAAAAAAG